MKKRRDEFVVGFPGAHKIVWGRDSNGELRWADPMTAKQALEEDDAMIGGAKVYRLVPVPLAEVEAQAAREARAKKGARR